MFTGIVAAVGRITTIEPLGDQGRAGVRLEVAAGGLSLSDVAIGDSIAINGACMTVTHKSDSSFTVDVSRESLDCTVGLDAPGEVNLERALTLAERLGGHLVSGHVDGLGRVVYFAPVGESWRLDVLAPATLGKYLAYKGSVVINGVSLTVNSVADNADGSATFGLNIIPHTWSVTALGDLATGQAVNIEIDVLARYLARMQERLSTPPHS